MGKKAILFPGQGAQKVGMGKDFYDAAPAAREIYERANAVLDIDIAKICFDGPDDELNDTAVCQAAVLVTSIAALEALKVKCGGGAAAADMAAGLSLGEYTALTYAGAIEFEDAVRLVRQRGTFMKQAGEVNPGTMLCLIGMSREDVAEAIASAGEDKGVLVAANFNSPGQIVLSGTRDAIDAAAQAATERNAKRVIPLTVSGAFHSPLMEPAAEKLKAELAAIEIKSPAVPVVSNVAAKYVGAADEIRDLLVRQLTSSVMWEDSMRFMISEGMTEALEVGPGRVLSGLLAKTDRSVSARNVAALTDLE